MQSPKPVHRTVQLMCSQLTSLPLKSISSSLLHAGPRRIHILRELQTRIVYATCSVHLTFLFSDPKIFTPMFFKLKVFFRPPPPNELPQSIYQCPEYIIFPDCITSGGPGSSVGIATNYRLDGPGSIPGGDEIFLPSRPALEPTQPPV